MPHTCTSDSMGLSAGNGTRPQLGHSLLEPGPAVLGFGCSPYGQIVTPLPYPHAPTVPLFPPMVSGSPWLMELSGAGAGEASKHLSGRGSLGFDLPTKADKAIPILGMFFTINLSPVLRD